MKDLDGLLVFLVKAAFDYLGLADIDFPISLYKYCFHY